jgi:hypothetical protein
MPPPLLLAENILGGVGADSPHRDSPHSEKAAC